jgi:hypothetical protein
VKNAITALIAGGADVNARCRLGAFRNGPHEMLARPFHAVCAYRGVAGTVGDALFLAAVAATSPATPLETRLECVDVAARLIASGADLEARGTRPGSGHGCGEDLAPLAMALAAMEQDACAASGAYGDDPSSTRFFEYALDDVDGNPNATLAAALLAAERVSAADSDSESYAEYAESETSGKSSSRSDAGADADPTRVRLSAGRLDALVSALKHTHGRDVTREQARALVGETRDSHAYAISESSLRSADDVSSETGDTRSREKEPAVDVGAVTTFAHVPTRREFRARRLAVGETGAAAPASGPPLWHAACAAAEGAGAPAVAAARKLLKLGADPDAVGSRPGHCLPGTPALAMCVAALRGRARHPSPRHDRDWWPASETDGEAAKVQVPSRRADDASSASSAVSSFRAETLNPRRVSGVPEVSPAARHARAAFEAEVVRGLERFLETNADRNAGPVSKPGADLVTGADARIGYRSRAIGAPFRWSARAEADAVASANAIAVAHRETRLAAAETLRASVADLRAYVPWGRPRGRRLANGPVQPGSARARGRAGVGGSLGGGARRLRRAHEGGREARRGAGDGRRVPAGYRGRSVFRSLRRRRARAPRRVGADGRRRRRRLEARRLRVPARLVAALRGDARDSQERARVGGPVPAPFGKGRGRGRARAVPGRVRAHAADRAVAHPARGKGVSTGGALARAPTRRT